MNKTVRNGFQHAGGAVAVGLLIMLGLAFIVGPLALAIIFYPEWWTMVLGTVWCIAALGFFDGLME